ncbi:MAG TPA: FG-GAP-like repeat-containing protein [Bryobacterales bacterium]|nr:FG-GAP-like repeat-containing protein [Bryobacterales bacterium]
MFGILAPNFLLAETAFLRKDTLVGEAPYAVVAGDFNGDGRPDLAVATADGLYVLLNAGGGNFKPAVRTEAAPATFWLDRAADFNGDGLDDLVGSGFLYLSRGDGTFLPPRYLGAQEAVAAGDFNHDGKMDLLISNYAQGEGVRVLLGNGDGTFHAAATVTSTPVSQVRVTDFNRDGRADVATILTELKAGEPAKNFLLVFLGRGDGTFGPEIRTQLNNNGGVLVADFNGDGLPDIFTESYGPPGNTIGSVLLGKGDGSFQSPIPYLSYLESNAYGFPVAAGDFTGDGHADLVLAGGNGFYICPGKGDGTFLPPVEQSMPLSFALTAVDLDGDGHLDLATVNSSNSMSVLLFRTAPGPELRRALSAANYTAVVTPESLVTLFAPTPATASESASPPWPTQLGGISLEVRDSTGATHLAPLVFVSPTQINFQVPTGAALGEATLSIKGSGGSTVAGSMEVDAVAPALFISPDTRMPVMNGVMVEPDGTQVPVAELACNADLGGCWPAAILLSTAGGRPIYLSFYGTGFRGATTGNVTCYVRNADGANVLQLPVVYAGPQETPGVNQINVRLLPEVAAALSLGGGPGGEWGGFVTIRINGLPANRGWIYGQ